VPKDAGHFKREREKFIERTLQVTSTFNSSDGSFSVRAGIYFYYAESKEVSKFLHLLSLIYVNTDIHCQCGIHNIIIT